MFSQTRLQVMSRHQLICPLLMHNGRAAQVANLRAGPEMIGPTGQRLPRREALILPRHAAYRAHRGFRCTLHLLAQTQQCSSISGNKRAGDPMPTIALRVAP